MVMVLGLFAASLAVVFIACEPLNANLPGLLVAGLGIMAGFFALYGRTRRDIDKRQLYRMIACWMACLAGLGFILIIPATTSSLTGSVLLLSPLLVMAAGYKLLNNRAL
jgi:hypothetical protein